MSHRKPDGEHVHPWVMVRLPRDLVERARAAWPELLAGAPELKHVRTSDAAAVRVLVERALRGVEKKGKG